MLNGERLEPALPDVPAALVLFVVTANMSVLQPVHPAAQVAVLDGPDDEVKVVGHQAPSGDRHLDLDASVTDGLQEGVVVAVLVEDSVPAVAPVQDVVADTADRGSWCAWHKVIVAMPGKDGNNKCARPLLLLVDE